MEFQKSITIKTGLNIFSYFQAWVYTINEASLYEFFTKRTSGR